MTGALVTGAGSLLGSNLVAELTARGTAVASLDRALGGPDITDTPRMEALLYHLKPRWIVHCAALTDIDWCESHAGETHQVNAGAPARLAAIARKLGAGFVFVSTDSVFDGMRGDYREDDVARPLNVYARAKWEGENAVLAAHPQALVVRTNVYGWNPRAKRGLAEWVLRRLEYGSLVPGFQDVRFCPLLVNDFAGLLHSMMERRLAGTYHVAGSDAVSMYEFATALAQTFGYGAGRVVSQSLSTASVCAMRPLDTSLCVEKAAAALNRPLPGLHAGLERFRSLRPGDCNGAYLPCLPGFRSEILPSYSSRHLVF